jgi:hypothetical protein
MAAPITPAATVPPLAKESASGGVSSRSSTATRWPGPSSCRVPSSNTKRKAISTCGSAPAALKPSKSRTAFGRRVTVPRAAFHAAEKKAAAGPAVSTATRRDTSPSRPRLATQSPGRLPSAMLAGTAPRYLTTGISCLSLVEQGAGSSGGVNES